MSIIKSFSVCDDNGEAGDMFYIKHNSSNFTIIDCCLNCEVRESVTFGATTSIWMFLFSSGLNLKTSIFRVILYE